jgi:hypothetical protein
VTIVSGIVFLIIIALILLFYQVPHSDTVLEVGIAKIKIDPDLIHDINNSSIEFELDKKAIDRLISANLV